MNSLSMLFVYLFIPVIGGVFFRRRVGSAGFWSKTLTNKDARLLTIIFGVMNFMFALVADHPLYPIVALIGLGVGVWISMQPRD